MLCVGTIPHVGWITLPGGWDRTCGKSYVVVAVVLGRWFLSSAWEILGCCKSGSSVGKFSPELEAEARVVL